MSGHVRAAVIVTEEEDVPLRVEAISGDYIVCFDPIDGSSNIDAAVTTGSIFGVRPGRVRSSNPDATPEAMEKCVLNTRKSGEELVCAGYVMYSSATVMMLTVGDGVYGFTLDTSTGEYVLSHEDVKIPETTEQRIYSGNHGNVDKWAPEMKARTWSTCSSAARRRRAVHVPIHRRPRRGFPPHVLYGGIWLYPPDSSAPQGKARLLYEVAPMGYSAEQAGAPRPGARWRTSASWRSSRSTSTRGRPCSSGPRAW